MTHATREACATTSLILSFSALLLLVAGVPLAALVASTSGLVSLGIAAFTPDK